MSANMRGTVNSQMSVTGGVTIEADAIQNLRLKDIERYLDEELADLKKEMMKEVKKMRRR